MLLVIMLVQLTLGAAMRHTGSGLAIPDFPSAYGQLVPPFNAEDIEIAADNVLPENADFEVYPSPMQVGVHFAHRVWAVVVIIMSMIVLAKISPIFEQQLSIQRIAFAIIALLLIQIGLGASIIWTGKHPEVATAHQMIGAGLLAMVTWLTVRVSRVGPVQPQLTKASQSMDHGTLAVGAGA
jgi:cytochrome c oxidase assembly protein subunit 15